MNSNELNPKPNDVKQFYITIDQKVNDLAYRSVFCIVAEDAWEAMKRATVIVQQLDGVEQVQVNAWPLIKTNE